MLLLCVVAIIMIVFIIKIMNSNQFHLFIGLIKVRVDCVKATCVQVINIRQLRDIKEVINWLLFSLIKT